MKRVSAKEILKEVTTLKEEYPNYKHHCEIEYQLDRNMAVVMLSYPYENELNADYEMECLGYINVEEVYQVANAIHKDIQTIISDTSLNGFYHQDTLENTLKNVSHLFDSNYGGSREWLVQKEEKQNEL